MTRGFFKLVAQMVEYQFTPELISLLPFDLTGLCRYNQKCYLLDSSQGKFALWIHQGQEASLALQSQLHTVCKQAGTPGLLYPVELANGRTYERFNERFWFYITEWRDFGKVSYGRFDHLRSVIGVMADFRRAITRNNPSSWATGIGDNRNLLSKLENILEDFNKYSMLARYRLRPTKFDRLFQDYQPILVEQVKKALMLLEKSEYLSIFRNLPNHSLIIADYSRSNLRIANQQVYCLKLKNCRRELPIIDLATLLEKSGRSNKWALAWFDQMSKCYQSHFDISAPEWLILKIYLSVPWGIYKLASRYYFNRVEWGTAKFIAKLERLLADEENRLQLLKNL